MATDELYTQDREEGTSDAPTGDAPTGDTPAGDTPEGETKETPAEGEGENK